MDPGSWPGMTPRGKRSNSPRAQLFLVLGVSVFFHFLYPLKDIFGFFNVFRYITFRTVGVSVTAFIACLLLLPLVTRFLSKLKVTNDVQREHAEKIHSFYADKALVPTMGGVLIVAAILISNLLWADLSNRYIVLALSVVFWYGLLGFVDDFLKLKSKNSKGLSGKVKFIGQLILGLTIAIILYRDTDFSKLLYVPFFKNVMLPMGLLFNPFTRQLNHIHLS